MTSVNWELTPYEQCRKPHETLPGNTEIAVSPCNLHSELQCPICLDILTNTMTTKECLHRFCAECITTALRNGNKECPTCRKKLVSHRSLRKDTTFDAIVAKIFPDRTVYEQQIEKRIAKLIQMNASDRFGPHTDRVEGSDDSNTHPSSVTSKSNHGATKPDKSNEGTAGVLELQMRLHDDSSTNDEDVSFFKSKYFSTSPNASIDHLVEFLKIRFQAFKQQEKLDVDGDAISTTDCPYTFSIYLPDLSNSSSTDSGSSPLEGHLTLAEITRRLKCSELKEPLELVYKVALP